MTLYFCLRNHNIFLIKPNIFNEKREISWFYINFSQISIFSNSMVDIQYSIVDNERSMVVLFLSRKARNLCFSFMWCSCLPRITEIFIAAQWCFSPTNDTNSTNILILHQFDIRCRMVIRVICRAIFAQQKSESNNKEKIYKFLR